MTASDFSAWLLHMDYNDSDAERVLGITRKTIRKYRVEGAPAWLGFACAAIAFGLPAWRRAE